MLFVESACHDVGSMKQRGLLIYEISKVECSSTVKEAHMGEVGRYIRDAHLEICGCPTFELSVWWNILICGKLYNNAFITIN